MRRLDERFERRIVSGVRLSMWIGPAISGITIYVALREVLSTLLGRLVLP